MPFFQVSDDFDLSKVPQELRDEFKVYTPEDVAGLKSKRDELLGEVSKLKDFKTKYESLSSEHDALKTAYSGLEASAASGGDAKQQLQDALTKLETKSSELDNLKNEMIKKDINHHASELAGSVIDRSLPNGVERAKLLAEKIAARTKRAESGDGFTYLNDNGDPTIADKAEFLGSISQAYSFLVDGSKATGGNAPGGKGEASPTKAANAEAEAAKAKGDLTGFLNASLQGDKK